jgi:hypothetical protein
MLEDIIDFQIKWKRREKLPHQLMDLSCDPFHVPDRDSSVRMDHFNFGKSHSIIIGSFGNC